MRGVSVGYSTTLVLRSSGEGVHISPRGQSPYIHQRHLHSGSMRFPVAPEYVKSP